MCARDPHSDLRDQAMARLLAEALNTGAASSHACPDAELVAAYADQGLADGERHQLETHFADCARCQKLLAALAVGLDASVGESVAVLPAPIAVPVAPAPAPSTQRWLWWLSPAFGAAAAALLWMALRPAAPQPVQTAADYSRAGQPETGALRAPASPQNEEEAPPVAAERRDRQAVDRLSKTESEAKEDRIQPGDQDAAQLAAQRSNAAPASAPRAPAARSEVTTAIPAQAPAALAMTAPAPPPRNQAAAAEQASMSKGTTVLGGTLSARSLTDPQAGGGVAAQGGLYTFTSPTGAVMWRVGAAGLIEKSADMGQTWQQQASGMTVDLLAGSASSDEVAWVVGRAAVILRTINGQQWQKVVPPAGVTGDWVTIVVRSGSSATVVAGDLRRFSTEDGGRTWIQQP